MITGLTWLVGYQLVGEVLVRLADVPVPGPVVGMVLLVADLEVRRRRGRDTDREPVVRAAGGLLRHLQLLFVPAGVGVVAHLSDLRADAVPIIGAMVGSWLLGLVVVAWTARLLERGRA